MNSLKSSANFNDDNIFIKPQSVPVKNFGSCKRCLITFKSVKSFYDHIITHVSLPTIYLSRIRWPIVLKINKDRLSQTNHVAHEFEKQKLNDLIKISGVKRCPKKQPSEFKEPYDDKVLDSTDKHCPLKLTIKKSDSAGSPAFSVVLNSSRSEILSEEGSHFTEANFDKFAACFMTDLEENSDNDLALENKDLMLEDDNYSSTVSNANSSSELTNSMSDQPSMEEVNGMEEDTQVELTAKMETEDIDKKLILKLTSKKEFPEPDLEENDQNCESKEGSLCDEEEMSFKNGIIKQSVEDLKGDETLGEESDDKDVGSNQTSPSPSPSLTGNSMENSNVSPEAELDSDSGINSEKESESKQSEPPQTKPLEGVLRVRSSSEMLKSSVSDFDSKDSDPLSTPDNGISDAYNVMGEASEEPASVTPIREGLTVLSAEQLGATTNSSCESDNLLQNMDYQNQMVPGMNYNNYGMPNDNSVEFMPLDQLGSSEMCSYKCNLGPDCSNLMFVSAADLSNHQAAVHNIVPPVQQLAQQFSGQVQRLQVPQSQAAVSPSGSPFQVRGMPSPQYRQSMSPHSGLMPPKQSLAPSRYPPSAQSRFSPSQVIRPRMQIVPGPVNGRGQPLVGRGGIGPGKRPGQPLGRGAAPIPNKRRFDTLMPSRLEDNDCHVIAMQKRNNDAGLVIQNVQGRDNNLFQLSDAITLSLRNQQPKENPTKSVTNILATRGITVTPSSGGKTNAIAPRRNSPTEAALTSLNLNSAISIISTNTGNSPNKPMAGNSGFAVPKGVVRTNVTERPPRPPTVDLTGSEPPQRLGQSQFTCQVCDKLFSSPESLNQHMHSHRTGTKLPFRCNLCNAQYPTQPALAQHKKTHHRDSGGTEMALPVVDLKQPGTLGRLQQLGVKFCIPLAQLGNQSGGVFGLPVISIDGAKNPAVCNLSALGASNILSLGPIKSLGR